MEEMINHKQSISTSHTHTLKVSHGMMRSFGVVTLLIVVLVTVTTLPTYVAAVESEMSFTPIFDASFVDTDAPIVCHSAADCSGNGVCKSGVCMCIQPWTGPSCSRKSCPNQCSGTGRCDTMTGQCHCYNATELARIYPTDGPDHEWGFEGDDCSRKTCFSDCGVKNGFGECNKDTGLCECKKGFWGPEGMHCNSVLCDDNCSNHGFCVDNHCLCDIAANRMSGWTGEKCEKPVCPNHCMESVGLGKCVDAKCECTEGWYGEDCSKKMCPVNYSPLAWIGAKKVMCSGFGECDNGVCKCVEGFTGEDCSIRVCPGMSFHGASTNVSCSGHGTCQFNGLCLCDPGYTGEDCFERTCPTDCGAKHGHGSCNGETGQCECEEDRYGADCSFLICDDSCNGNGRCLDDRCVCKPGFQGPHCEQVVCAHNCSYAEGQGECVNGKCVCTPGFYGVECLYPECPRTMNPITRVPDLICGGNGVCTEGKCVCNAAWKGADCTVRACPYNCSDVGICGPDGTCTCPEGGPDGRGGFTGKFCEVTICPSNCGEDKGLGKCVDSECVCKPGQGQPDCLYDACPLGLPPLASAFTKPLPCSGTGTCVKGACVCQPGWTGKACSDRPCLNDCNDNGICQSNGLCKCHDRFNGSDCSTEGCPSGCSGHGSCMGDDICKCDPRWTGERCEIAKCPNGCSGNGECVRRLATEELPATELCLCDPGYQGADCSQPICEPISADGKMCKGRGRCVVTHNGRHVCRCDSPFAGAECGNLACNATCSYHGVCTGSNVPHEKCECDEGWFGENCDRTGNCEPFDCYGRGKCVAGLKGAPTCQCKAPFGGPDCSLCTHNCNGHGTCTPNGCVCVDGWQGPLCDRREDCDPKDCGGPSHGTCVADADGLPVCKCKFPWTDFDCLQCTLTCNEHGECNEQGKCTCDKGWKGENCERYGDCPNDCSGKGTCIADDIGDPVCKCEPGYAGRDCGNIVCNKKCPKNSRCLDDECVCEEGWTGDFCDERNDCPDNCSGLGTCMADLQGKPFCKCQIGRGGPACQFQSCSKTCSDHGSCFIEKGEQKCLCEPGFGGAECEKQDCSAWANCGGPKHGTCGQDERGMPKCLCLHPYTGTNCTDVLCSPDACKHGTCVNAKCQCEAGWKGPKCDYRVPCPAPGCGEAGRCIGDEKGVGKCECNPGFTGPNCLDVICTDKCSGHGKCVNQACVCDPGFHGEKCEITAPCPNNCNGHGQCNYDEKAKKSVCDCEDMWDSGDGKGDCSVQRGKTWIDSSGRLQYKCAPPYFGNLCQSKGCLKPCQNGGKCALDGACDCPPGFKGVDCSETVCPKGCSGGGQCDLKAKQCRCFFGYSGPACENFNQDICQSTCSFKCSLVGANGLISIFDKDYTKRWVASRDCHKMCRLPGMCAIMFGTGHPNSNNKVTGDLVTIAKK